MLKMGLILFCLLAVGCIQNTYNITPEFHNSGAVNIDSRVDADDPRVTVTVDDVTMDWKELKEMVEKKMAAMPKETQEKTLLGAVAAPAHAPLPAPRDAPPPVKEPALMTHSVQVGAYRQLENAEQQVARLAEAERTLGLFVVLATIMNGLSNNEVSKVEGLNGLEITSLSFLVVSPFALALLLGTDIHAVFLTSDWPLNFGYIVILAVVGSAFANAMYYFLVRDTSPVVASVVAYFIPIVATMWGLADNEHLATTMWISVFLILAGVYLINSKWNREKNPKANS